jgi:hypothetical protein
MGDYSYMNSGGGMILLLLILGALMVYLLFSKGFWMDRFMKSSKWEGEDVEPHYQEGTPFTPALEKPFNDPEVPNRPSKKKKPKKKRVYKRKRKGK